MDAIRFTCQAGCTNCCEQKGNVYLTEDDLKRAAAATMPGADGSRKPAAADLCGRPLRTSEGQVMQPAGVPDPRGLKQAEGRHSSRQFGASVSC